MQCDTYKNFSAHIITKKIRGQKNQKMFYTHKIYFYYINKKIKNKLLAKNVFCLYFFVKKSIICAETIFVVLYCFFNLWKKN